MKTQYKAAHITIFAVYKKFVLLGKPMRYLKVAYPDYAQAEEWVKHEIDKGLNVASDFMIEEMPAIMKAW